MNILVTGGTGFIGSHLIPSLTKDGHLVTILSRNKKKSKDRLVSYLEWNGKEMPAGIGLYDVVINLAGASIAGKRWTESRKQLILDSRIHATQACVNYINSSPNPPSLFISASGVGYYGIDKEQEVDEFASPGEDFPANVCKAWEAVADKAECRTVKLRMGVVLGTEGGALEQMLPIYKFYLGGTFASGKQGFPWIHIQDVVNIFQFIMSKPNMEGPVNLVAPHIVDQQSFSHSLADALGTKDFFVVPKFALNLIFGEQAMLFWGGQKTIPRILQREKYQFSFPDLDGALEDLVG